MSHNTCKSMEVVLCVVRQNEMNRALGHFCAHIG